MSLSLVVAVSANNCIGKDGALPWHIPEDIAHFKALTLHKTVLMGRKTWESLPATFRPLPQRTNIVITRQTDYALPLGVERYDTLEAALRAHAGEELMIIGGAQIYHETLPFADTVYLTRVHQEVAGDTFFPVLEPTSWRESEREDYPTFSFVTYQKI